MLSSDEFPGRVITVKGHRYTVISQHAELDCELSGKLLFGSDPEGLPKVGDWVTFLDYGDTGIITMVLQRRNMLARRKPGNSSERQILATNIDAALIVQSVDSNFNLMRLERYIVQVTACGIYPVVVLNKIDLTDNPGEFKTKVQSLARDVSVVLCSTVTESGLSQLWNLIRPGLTYILVGSSGVGKSSLLNRLMDDEIQPTGSISL